MAFQVEPDPRVFAQGSVLYFVSEGGALNSYGNEAVYELETSSGGERMERIAATPRGAAVSFYGARVEQEENRYYQAGLLEAPDLWLWDVLLAPSLKSYSFYASQPATVSEPARLSLWLQGVSDTEASPDHHLRLSLNGVWIAETSFDGKKPLALTVDLPAGTLREGENSVEIQNLGDTGAPYSMVMLDRFAVSYPRRLVAEGGGLRGTFSETGAAEVEGLPANGLVVELTGPQPKWLQGMKGTGRGLTFSVEAGREYLAVSREAVLKPEVRKPSAVTLKSSLNRADYLVVGPQALLEAAKPLLELRRSQGLKSRAVAIEQVYEEFGYGESRPEAVRELL
ncbi:MAG: C25 family cysteine peptidase, partial [Acidobacteria bacterium]|nr:C25 family cysteine peptidase [Acidobacteriota bacterium]